MNGEEEEDDDECKHGLPSGTCYLCKHPGRRPPSYPTGESGAFPARYNGTCPECGQRIRPGQMIRVWDEGFVHDAC
jgi:hypothetical protein